MEELEKKYDLYGFHYGYSGVSQFLLVKKGIEPEDFKQMLFEAAMKGTPTPYPSFLQLKRRPVEVFNPALHPIVIEGDEWDRLSNEDLTYLTTNMQKGFAAVMFHVIFFERNPEPFNMKFYDLDNKFFRLRYNMMRGKVEDDPYIGNFIIQDDNSDRLYHNALSMFHMHQPYYKVEDLMHHNTMENMVVFTLHCDGKYMHIFAPKRLTRYELLIALQRGNTDIEVYPPPLHHAIRAVTNEDMKYPLMVSADPDFPISNDTNITVGLYINSNYFLTFAGRDYIGKATRLKGSNWATYLIGQALIRTPNLNLENPGHEFEAYQGTLGEISRSVLVLGALEGMYSTRINREENQRLRGEQERVLRPLKKRAKVIDDDSEDEYPTGDMSDYIDSEQEDDNYEIPSSEDEIIPNGKRKRNVLTKFSKRKEKVAPEEGRRILHSIKDEKELDNEEGDFIGDDDNDAEMGIGDENWDEYEDEGLNDNNDDLDFYDDLTGERVDDEEQKRLSQKHFNTGTLDTYLDGNRYVMNIKTDSRSYLITLISANPYYLVHILVPGTLTKEEFIKELSDIVAWYRRIIKEGRPIQPKPRTSVQVSNVYLGHYDKWGVLPLIKVFLNAWDLFDMTIIDNFWNSDTLDMLVAFIKNIKGARLDQVRYHIEDVGTPIYNCIRTSTIHEKMSYIFQQAVRGLTRDSSYFIRWKLFTELLIDKRTLNEEQFRMDREKDVIMVVEPGDTELEAARNDLISKDPKLQN